MSSVTTTEYANRVRLNVPFQQAIDKMIQALKAEGFGVLTEIDMQGTLKQKLGVEIRPYLILGVCHPPFAQRALAADPDAGLLLPCNVAVYEDGDHTVVSILDPVAMLKITENSAMHAVGAEAKQKLDRVLAAIA